MATANGGTLTITRGYSTIGADGNTTVQLIYSNASGAVVHIRVLTIHADGSSITDQFGNVIATPVPTALASSLTSTGSQLDTSIANGAAAGKLNL